MTHPTPLPAPPSLEYHKKQAKALLKAANDGDAASLGRMRRTRPGAAGVRSGRWALADAQLTIAREHGFASWPRFRAHVRSLQPVTQPHSSRVPRAEWDALLERAQKQGSVALNARGLATDADLERIGRMRRLRRLDLSRCRGITDAGLRHLAGLTELSELDLGMCDGITDAGLQVLRSLPKLTTFKIEHQRTITDRAIEHLSGHQELQSVSLMGTRTGDGAVRSLSGKKDLERIRLGDEITDAGLAGLHGFPVYRSWAGVEPWFNVFRNDTNVPWVWINLRAPVSDEGLRNLAGLDGLGCVQLFGSLEVAAFDSRRSPITPAGIRSLASLRNLVAFGCAASKSDDPGMEEIARLPRLLYLTAQDSVAGDRGFAALAGSRSLQHIFAVGCASITGRTLAALASLPRLRSLAVGGPGIRDADFDVLPDCRSLRHLIPAGAGDDAFHAIGRIASLEVLDCMFCKEITDRAIARIGGLERLVRISVWGAKIGDESLRALSRMSSLREVELWGCGDITDRGIDHLGELPALRVLNVLECPGVAGGSLRGLRRDVRVEWLS